MLWLIATALARPTEGGQWSFSDEDVVVSVDSADATARVWYSVEGPNQVKQGDADGNGVPDFAELVASYTEDVLATYAETGFRAPLSDGTGGGGAAMDVYLVDFGGSADGAYTAEACSGAPKQCSGYFVMENDFSGYGYASVDSAIRVLTSHELFHAVQAAYDAEEEVWFSEGTAVWAEHLYDPLNEDFLAFADAYLDDTGRSLDQPPSGPVPTFAYATTLWWWFLADRYGDDVMLDLLEMSEATDELTTEMVALQEARGGSLEEDWTTFARWNLATGRYAGSLDGYPFAEDIGPPRYEASDPAIVEDHRFYPLAASYFRLEHGGGEVWFAAAAEAPDVVFSLHPSDGEGAVGDAVATFTATTAPMSLGDLVAGDWWLVGTNPTLAEDSTKLLFCLGGEGDMAACAPADTGDTGDTGAEADTGGEVPGGCSCDASTGVGAGFGAMAMAVAGLSARRRRRLA